MRRRCWRVGSVVLLAVLASAVLYAAFGVGTAYVNNDGGTAVTSGSFNVSAGDLLVVVQHTDENSGDVDPAPTLTLSDNQTPDLTYTLINRRDDSDPDAAPAGIVAASYHVVVSNITGLTITLTVSGTGGGDSPAIKVYKAAAADFDSADVVGASVEGTWSTSGQQTSNITPETSGVGVMVATDWNENGVPTSADTTETGIVGANPTART